MIHFQYLRLLPDERCEKRHEFNGGKHVLELIESDVLIRHHRWIARRYCHDPVLAGGSLAVALFEPIKEPLTLPLERVKACL
jgi:hypothetical protein